MVGLRRNLEAAALDSGLAGTRGGDLRQRLAMDVQIHLRELEQILTVAKQLFGWS